MKVLVTGAAGFIGYHISKNLLEKGHEIIGVDNFNSYYDVQLKRDRNNLLEKYKNYKMYEVNLHDKDSLNSVFEKEIPEYVVNLGAQAGVRYSLTNPYAYMDSNMIGFLNVLESCRNNPVKHLIYASSSSVYGGNKIIPFSTNHSVDHPVSLYAATKKSNELMAHTYSYLYNIPTTGLRFFTVYGPYGRPDMAYYSFTKDIIEGNTIKVYNHGNMERDFTYIDDVVEGIFRLIDKPPVGNHEWDESQDELGTSFAPYRIYNIGNNSPVKLMKFINALEVAIGKEANKEYMDMQPGDVLTTYADIKDLEENIGFKPSTSIEEGLKRFVDWYIEYYSVDIEKAINKYIN